MLVKLSICAAARGITHRDTRVGSFTYIRSTFYGTVDHVQAILQRKMTCRPGDLLHSSRLSEGCGLTRGTIVGAPTV